MEREGESGRARERGVENKKERDCGVITAVAEKGGSDWVGGWFGFVAWRVE